MIKKSDYPEIAALENMVDTYRCDCYKDPSNPPTFKWLTPVIFKIKNKEFSFLIDDEYRDLDNPNRLLRVELMLRFLELFEESEDYLVWCRYHMLDSNTPGLLTYFRKVVEQYDLVSAILNQHPIECFLSDLDWELNAGAAQYLRTNSE